MIRFIAIHTNIYKNKLDKNSQW